MAGDNFDVSFTAKLEGVDTEVPVGDNWITITDAASTVIYDCTGWRMIWFDGRKCSDALEAIERGVQDLAENVDIYAEYLPKGIEVSDVAEFLGRILENCRKFPTAVIHVNIN